MEISTHTNGSVVAARCRSLGLTAYGHTESEAKQALHDLLSTAVEHHHGRGTLIDYLNVPDFEYEIMLEGLGGSEFLEGDGSTMRENHQVRLSKVV